LSHITYIISKTATHRDSVRKDWTTQELAYGVSNGHVVDMTSRDPERSNS